MTPFPPRKTTSSPVLKLFQNNGGLSLTTTSLVPGGLTAVKLRSTTMRWFTSRGSVVQVCCLRTILRSRADILPLTTERSEDLDIWMILHQDLILRSYIVSLFKLSFCLQYALPPPE